MASGHKLKIERFVVLTCGNGFSCGRCSLLHVENIALYQDGRIVTSFLGLFIFL